MSQIKKIDNVQKNIIHFGLIALLGLMVIVHPTFAGNEAATQIASIVSQMINIIGMIFSAVGVILLVYGIGQLIMAFKNDDPDSKTRSSTLVIVSIVLICFPAIVKGLNLVEMITDGR